MTMMRLEESLAEPEFVLVQYKLLQRKELWGNDSEGALWFTVVYFLFFPFHFHRDPPILPTYIHLMETYSHKLPLTLDASY